MGNTAKARVTDDRKASQRKSEIYQVVVQERAQQSSERQDVERVWMCCV